MLITYVPGHYPPMGRGIPPPPSRIPPYYTDKTSYRGDNPVNEIKIFLGKICPPP
jgi:hypothetical protein